MHVVYWTNANLAKAQVTERLRGIAGVELTVVDTLPALLETLPQADALVLYDAPASQARELAAALGSPGSKVRWMHILSAGREGLEAAGVPPGVAMTFAEGAVAPAVAEHAMALMLGLGRRLPDVVASTAAGKWQRGMAAKAVSLEGATLAIIGYGQIGQQIALRAHAFGARIVTVSRSPRRDPQVAAAYPMDELHGVLAGADFVAVTIALTPQTRHLIGAAEFAACKRGAVLVNVARGGLIDQAALCQALASGQLAGAGLDVTDPEPLPEGDPLWTCPNLLLSPHYAGAGSPKSIERIVDGVADNLRRFMAGEPLLHRLQA